MVGRRIARQRRSAPGWFVAGVNVTFAGALVASGVVGGSWPAWPGLVGLVALSAAAGLVTVRYGGWRSTLLPLALVVALGRMGPLAALAAVSAGAGMAVAVRSRALAASARALAVQVGAASVGAAAFALVGSRDGRSPMAAVGCVLAATAFTSGEWLSHQLEAPRKRGSARFDTRAAVTAAGAGVVAATTGVAIVRLETVGPFLPLLVLPLLGAVALGARQLAGRQDEHERLDRLAAATARTTGLRSFEAAVAQAAVEAGPLVGGTVAMSLAMGEDGTLVAAVVDEAGLRPASPDLTAALVEWGQSGNRGESDARHVPAAMRALCSEAISVVRAGEFDQGRPGALAVAVLRVGGTDGQSAARAQLLETFVGHAALIATNALLFQRVEAALRDQVDMNRQKDEFLAAVSHELRTPLASMLGSVETLRRLDGRMTPESRERFFTIANRQGKRLQRLIEELLLTASLDHRQEMVVATSCRLNEVLEEVAIDLALQSNDRIQVRCAPGAETLSTDPNKIRQVITNLAENATKYAPDGVIELHAEPRGDRIEVRVVDHGPGIPFTDRERAFERFVQLDGSSTRAQGGTGLGLYLCRRVADLLEADLALTDTPGGGATFILSLPRSHSATPANDEDRPAPSRPNMAASPLAGRGRPPGPYLDRSLLDLTRGPSSGPAAGLAARPVVPSGLLPPSSAERGAS